ncbi:MAG: HU family DNA-binding protein [Prevotellaceae bacterium]|jgi:cell division protein FtsN|nr:HU family DNA-binding protein [Prevotellaceae bacterium]
MIQTKLKSLVLENRRLIIPTVGAFLIKETGDSQKRVIFSSFLKYDDGLLTKLLCKQENISEEQAKQIVDKFAHEILDVINNGNNFSIANFGYFTKDKQGVVDFVVEDIDDTQHTKIAEPVKEEPKYEEPIFPPYVPPVIETPVFGNTGQEPKNDFDFSSIFNPPTDTTNTVTRKEKKNHAGYWILTIILIIIAVLLLLYLFSNDFKQTVNSLFGSKQKTEVITTPTATVVDTVKTVQPDVKDTVATQPEQVEPQTSSTSAGVPNGKYQVIAGCYIERSIAEDFVNELRNKGYSARIPDRLAGEWNLVIVYESNDVDDATRVKDSFVADGYEDAWVRTRGISENPTTTTSTSTSTSTSASNAQVTSYSNSGTQNTVRGKYQAVAGCFLERENAENFANELRSKGFDVRIPDRLMGEWTILILHESDDLDEANRVKEQCIAAGYDAWIRTRW